jgi:hypothetical protein
MDMRSVETQDQASEIRALTGQELDEVNGGLIGLVALGLALFGYGMAAGSALFDATHGAPVWDGGNG